MTCSSYILIPYEDSWPAALRVFLYLCGLLYCFAGLAIIMGTFMDAMENVVQQTRTVFSRDRDLGVAVKQRVKVWNPVIADITLLAFGTSAPPIFLSILSAIRQLGSPEGDSSVGIGTIAGGAASNFFPTLAWCILIPTAVKKIEKLEIFLLEAFWATWAYVWLYIVSEVWTPGEITMVEALLTILHTAILLLHAYAQDRRCPYLSFSLGRGSSSLVHPFILPTGAHASSPVTSPRPRAASGLEPKGSRLSLLDYVAPLGGSDTAGVPLGRSDTAGVPLGGSGKPGAQVYRDAVSPHLGGHDVPGSQSNRPAARETGAGELNEGPAVLCPLTRSSPARCPSRISPKTPLSSPPTGGAQSTREQAANPGPAPGHPVVASEGGMEQSVQYSQQRATQQPVTLQEASSFGGPPGNPRSPLREIPGSQRSQSFNRRGGVGDHFVSVDGMRRRSLGKVEGEECTAQFPPGGRERELEPAVERTQSLAGPRTSSSPLGHHTREGVPQLWAQFSDGTLPRTAARPSSTFLPPPQDQPTQSGHSVHSVHPAQAPLEMEKGRGGSGAANAGATSAGAGRRSGEEVPSLGAAWKLQIVNSFLMTGEARKDFEPPLREAPPLNFASLEGQTSTWHSLSTWHTALGSLKSALLLLSHALALFWRVVFAVLVPPPNWAHGWPAYLGSLCLIAGICAIVIELSSLFACASGADSFVVSITLLAAGTSIPSIIGSAVSAHRSDSADSAMANINCSNAVNVFIGLGVPWVISAAAAKASHKSFFVDTTGLASSLVAFLVVWVLGLLILLLRRRWVGGELGGSRLIGAASSLSYVLLWFIYITFASLSVYKLL